MLFYLSVGVYSQVSGSVKMVILNPNHYLQVRISANKHQTESSMISFVLYSKTTVLI